MHCIIKIEIYFIIDLLKLINTLIANGNLNKNVNQTSKREPFIWDDIRIQLLDNRANKSTDRFKTIELLNFNFKVDLQNKNKTTIDRQNIPTTTNKLTTTIINNRLKNRDIKISYKINPDNLTWKAKKTNKNLNFQSNIIKTNDLMNSIFSFDFIEDESNEFSYYVLKINKDFLFMALGTFTVIFIALILIVCLFRCMEPRNL